MGKRKRDEILASVCFFCGLAVVMGSAGASDLERIGLSELIVNMSLGIVIVVIGFLILEKEAKNECD